QPPLHIQGRYGRLCLTVQLDGCLDDGMRALRPRYPAWEGSGLCSGFRPKGGRFPFPAALSSWILFLSALILAGVCPALNEQQEQKNTMNRGNRVIVFQSFLLLNFHF
ncbi:hypothetical protein ACFOQM_09625, partial [Paenibacillus sp. GCM10012307]|uniref:hypothetical protein n=1 Tax=Paenibacillus TaxID=44249 RepID=UPI001E631052